MSPFSSIPFWVGLWVCSMHITLSFKPTPHPHPSNQSSLISLLGFVLVIRPEKDPLCYEPARSLVSEELLLPFQFDLYSIQLEISSWNGTLNKSKGIY